VLYKHRGKGADARQFAYRNISFHTARQRSNHCIQWKDRRRHRLGSQLEGNTLVAFHHATSMCGRRVGPNNGTLHSTWTLRYGSLPNPALCSTQVYFQCNHSRWPVSKGRKSISQPLNYSSQQRWTDPMYIWHVCLICSFYCQRKTVLDSDIHGKHCCEPR
jgi:hypothetical protein